MNRCFRFFSSIAIGVVFISISLPRFSLSQADLNEGYGGERMPDDDYQAAIRHFDDRETLPSQYIAPCVTPAKQQIGLTCAHFAITGVLESRVMCKCGGVPLFSEQKTLSCCPNDGSQPHHDVSGLAYWEDHGAISEWCGPLGPETVEYTHYNEDTCNTMDDCWIDDDRLSDFYTLEWDHVNDVKASIFQDGPGALYYLVYSDFNNGDSSWDYWHDASPGEVYYAGPDQSDGGPHVVMIIGWDDWAGPEDKRGAWICKNSWGESNGPNGDGTFYLGYFWHETSLDLQIGNIGASEESITCDYDDDSIGPYINADDYIDNCPENFNPSQSDIDDDHWGDVCDEDIDGDGLVNSSDDCPYIYNPNQEDMDDDGIGDVCDDSDDDGVLDAEDNCPDVSNADQLNCDNDDPPVGDACDTDHCAYFCGSGVESVAGSSIGGSVYSGILTTWGTPPEEIRTEYCAVGPAGSTDTQKHDSQIRWCDCGEQEMEDCEDQHCSDSTPNLDYDNSAYHGGWHLMSWKTEGLIQIDPTAPDPGGVDESLLWYPSSTCHRNDVWSDWYADEGLNDPVEGWEPTSPWHTYHCAPQSVQYSDPSGTVEEKSARWAWSRELWWRQPEVNAPFDLPGKVAPSWGTNEEFGRGRAWIRPAIGIRDIYEANNYTNFILNSGGMKMSWILALPYFYFLIPPVEDLWTDDNYGNVFPGIRSPLVALFAMSVEQSATAGKLAYSSDVRGADASVGGLVVLVADGASLQPRSIAYSTGYSAGSVPNTTGFAAAQFSVDTQLQAFDTFAVESAGTGQGRMRGVIAAFGGTLASGQLSADLWFGTFSGLDEEQTPFFTWTKAPVQSGQAPAGRTGAGLAYDKATNRLILFGGKATNNGAATDIWAYDLGSQTWSLLDQVFPDVNGFVVAQGGSRVFVAGGKANDDVTNTKVYMLSLRYGTISEIGDLNDGPGTRTGIALAYAASRAGKLLVFGGTDPSGVVHTDVWEYDIASQAWSQRVADCTASMCPSGVASLLVTNAHGLDLGVYSAGRTGNEMFFISSDAGEWMAASSVAPSIPAQDCNGDGVLDPDSSKACRVSNLWYAPVQRQICGVPGSGQTTICTADAPRPMTEIASWQPDGWEWIMDMTTGPDGYTYIVTDTALYTFDSRDAADGLDPLDVDEFGGWAGADWGIDAEMVAGYLYVGASSGVHIFSLDDPENPQEVAYTPSYSPVLDMASLENALYLADGQGITVLDVSDPAAPAEVKRVSLGSKLALKVGVDEETRGLLVLTLATLERFSVQANPVNPVFSKRRSLLGALMTEMKVDGRWAYFNGLLSTDTVFWDGLNLVKKGTHDLRDWTDGRALRDGMAERVQPLQNKYEVWAE